MRLGGSDSSPKLLRPSQATRSSPETSSPCEGRQGCAGDGRARERQAVQQLRHGVASRQPLDAARDRGLGQQAGGLAVGGRRGGRLLQRQGPVAEAGGALDAGGLLVEGAAIDLLDPLRKQIDAATRAR